MNTKLLSIDFDGVIIRLFGNKEWLKREDGATNTDTSRFLQLIEVLGQYVFQYSRVETSRLSENLEILSKDYSLNIVTSRYPHVHAPTEWWLKHRNLDKYFDTISYNTQYEIPWEFKAKRIAELGAQIHIDDSFETVSYLAKTLKEVTIIWFDGYASDRALPEGYQNLIRMSSWDEIVKYLKTNDR